MVKRLYSDFGLLRAAFTGAVRRVPVAVQRIMEFVSTAYTTQNVTNVEDLRKNKYRKDSIVATIAGKRLIEITTRL